MLRKTGLIIAPILLVLITSSDLFAEKAPESKDEADHAVTALVEAVYTRTRTLDAGTAFETRQIEYVIELDVQEVQRGEEAKVGKRFYAFGSVGQRRRIVSYRMNSPKSVCWPVVMPTKRMATVSPDSPYFPQKWIVYHQFSDMSENFFAAENCEQKN